MTTAVTVHPTDTPAAELPFSMAVDVHAVLTAHGLDADMVDVLSAVWRIIPGHPHHARRNRRPQHHWRNTMTDVDTAAVQEEHGTQIRSGSIIYKLGRCPLPLGLAAIEGGHHGMITEGDLPDVVRADVTLEEYDAYCAKLHQILEKRGVLAVYRAKLQMDSRPVSCPFWCKGDHSKFADGMDSVEHTLEIATMVFDEVSSQPERRVTTAISALDTGEEMSPARIFCGASLDRDLTAQEARSIAQGLTRAADRLEALERAALAAQEQPEQQGAGS
jgi:hypothetical protein